MRRPRFLSARYLAVAGMLLHLVLAFSTGLSPDEAHYALYGAHVDWSYFDHPPLVGWLQAPFVLAGGADGLMRIVPMVSWLLTAVLAVKLCRELPSTAPDSPAHSDRRAAWAVGLLLLSPTFDLLGVALVPDALLMPLVLAAMLATWRLRDPSGAKNWRTWTILALISGLSILSKYTGVFISLGVLLSLVVFHGKGLWRYPGLWLVALVTLAAAMPVLWWNASHHWASFAYQAGHAAGSQGWKVVNMVRAVALQALMYGLLMPAGLILALRKTPIGAVGQNPRLVRASRDMAFAFGLPVLLTFSVLAGGGSSLPHWTACGWAALIPLSASGCLTMNRKIARGLLAWQVFLTGFLLMAVNAGGFSAERGSDAVSPPGVRPRGTVVNPVADLFGWESAALRGAALAQQHHVSALVVMNWSLASRLAWYARPMPVVVVPDHTDQFAFWFGHLTNDESALVVDWSQMPLTVPMGPHGFASCEPVEQISTMHGDRQIAHFNYLICRHWHGSDSDLASVRQ